MSQARSLPFQASCIRDVLDNARSPEIREGLEGAIATLEWLNKHNEIIRMWHQLRMSRPELFEALYAIAKEFPEVRITDVREAAE